MVSQKTRRAVTLVTASLIAVTGGSWFFLSQDSTADLYNPPSNLQSQITKASEATFEIVCELGEEEFFTGTGWNLRIGESNYVVTNAHVIDKCIGADGLYLSDQNNDLHSTEILGYRHVDDYRGTIDVAVLRGRPELPTLELSNQDPEPGHWVMAVGWPVLYDISYRAVIQGTITGTPAGGDLISDLDTHGGTSGSALLNSRGEVVGIHYASTPEGSKRSLAQTVSRLCDVALVCDQHHKPVVPLQFPDNPIKTYIPDSED